MRFMLLCLPLVFCAGGAVFAQDVDCAKAQTQADLTDCAGQDWDRADVELNAVYARAVAAMKEMDSYLEGDMKGAEESLRTAQRAWIAYRDAACETDGFLMRGGTGELMLVYGCKARLTEERTAHLRNLAEAY
jgi:uncharacterized protein YecT (DUF1311 family)